MLIATVAAKLKKVWLSQELAAALNLFKIITPLKYSGLANTISHIFIVKKLANNFDKFYYQQYIIELIMAADSTQLLQIIIDRFRELCRYRQPAMYAAGAEAVEVVHDMRVCIRRLRVILRLYQQLVADAPDSPVKTLAKLARKVRRLAAKLGEVRDLDVQSALLNTFLAGDLNPSEAKILRQAIKRCQKQRPLAQRRLVRYLRQRQPKLLKMSTLRQLESLSRATISENAGLSTAFSQALANFYQAATTSTASDPLHQLRIATKKLRYTLEVVEKITTKPLNSFIKPLKHLQEILGEIHDCDVTLHLLGFPVADNIIPLPLSANHHPQPDLHHNLSVESGTASLVTQLQARRQTLVQQYQQFWQATFDASFGERLTPFLQPSLLPTPIPLTPPPDLL
jgi:CHAD domain-containing protein